MSFFWLAIGLFSIGNWLMTSVIFKIEPDFIFSTENRKTVNFLRVYRSIAVIATILTSVIFKYFFAVEKLFLIIAILVIFSYVISLKQTPQKREILPAMPFKYHFFTNNLPVVFFKAVFLQKYFSFFLIAGQEIDNDYFPAELFILMTPLFFLVITPFLSGTFNYLRKGKLEPSNHTKILIGLFLGASGIIQLQINGISFMSFITFYFFLTISEILILPTWFYQLNKQPSEYRHFVYTFVNVFSGLLAVFLGLAYIYFNEFLFLSALWIIYLLIGLLLIIYQIKGSENEPTKV
jgi:hypothetical protein